MSRTIDLGSFVLGAGQPLAVVAGLCALEDEGSALRLAGVLKDITAARGTPFVLRLPLTKQTGRRSTPIEVRGSSRVWRLCAGSGPIYGSRCWLTFTNPIKRPQPPRSLTFYKSRHSCVGRPTFCWPPAEPVSRSILKRTVS